MKPTSVLRALPLLLLGSCSTSASTFYTLQLTHIDTGYETPTVYTLERTRITDSRVTDDMTIAEAFKAMKLSFNYTPSVSMAFRVKRRWGDSHDRQDDYLIESLPSALGSDNFVTYMNNLPPIVTLKTEKWGFSPTSTACVALGQGTKPSSATYWSYDTLWIGLGVASTSCDYRIPQPNEWCAPSTPSVTFDYGTKTVADALGTTLATEIKVECTTATKYSLRLKGLPSDLPLNNGMTATLTTDGQPAGATLSGVEGVNTVRLESTLSGTPDKAGPFNGEGVLFIQLH